MNFSHLDVIDVNFLKKHAKKIHFFGLGFIQIKLSDSQRLHIYTDKLKGTVSEEDIHNHRYDFRSHILKGTLTQHMYSVVGGFGGDYILTQESCNPDNKADKPLKFVVTILPLGSQTMVSGSTYSTDHSVFHRVQSTDAITLITRSEYKKEFADVVIPKEQEPVCPFSANVSEEELWAIVKDRLEAI